MVYILSGKIDELGKYTDEKKVERYLNEYLSFYEQFTKLNPPFDLKRDGIQGRKADRALWTFGRCLLTSGLPPLRDELGAFINITAQVGYAEH
jgi:hypothetical protein